MVLSRRERYIATGCAAVVGLLILLLAVLVPYWNESADLASQLKNIHDQMKTDAVLVSTKARMTDEWKVMQQHQLQTDETQAQILALTALNQWGPEAGVTMEGENPGKGIPQGPLDLIGFTLNGKGTTWSVSTLIWDLEHAGIPLRVNEVFIQPQTIGSDDLNFRMSISTVCAPPVTAKASAGAAGGQS